MVITKAVESVIDWTAVDQNVVSKSDTLDCSGHHATELCIQAFLDTETAHCGGTEFIIQVSSNTSGEEDWHDYTKFIALKGTAYAKNITNNPLEAGETTITMVGTETPPIKRYYETPPMGRWLAIKDDTLINSELVLNTGFTTDTNITILDGTTNVHTQNTLMYDIAISKVILLDVTVNRVRVVVNNTYNINGSSLNYKVRATEVTGIS